MRFVEVHRRHSPGMKTDELLSLVKARLSPGMEGGFATEVRREALRALKKIPASLGGAQRQQLGQTPTVLNLRDSNKKRKSYETGCA